MFMKSLTNIPGLGVKAEEALKRLHITQVSDLFWHFPSNVLHKKLYAPLHSLKEGDLAILTWERQGVR